MTGGQKVDLFFSFEKVFWHVLRSRPIFRMNRYDQKAKVDLFFRFEKVFGPVCDVLNRIAFCVWYTATSNR